jgi:poly(A) polymerase
MYDYTRQKIGELTPAAIQPKPLVSGDDLVAAGYGPGPQFKEILTAVEDAQLEGQLNSKDQAMDFVRGKFPQPTPP